MYGDIANFIVKVIGTSVQASSSAIQAAQTISPQIANALQTLAKNPDAFGQIAGWVVDAVVHQFEEYEAARGQQTAALLNHYPPQQSSSLVSLSALGLASLRENKPD